MNDIISQPADNFMRPADEERTDINSLYGSAVLGGRNGDEHGGADGQREPVRKSALQFIVITGLSGAGKGLAQHHFEDFGFFCVDNLPPSFLPMFAELCARGGIGRVAIVVDVRGGTFFNDLNSALEQLGRDGVDYQILFLDADDDLLIKRFKETRRRHPLSDENTDLQNAIREERAALASLRERADKIVNTSHVTPRELRAAIEQTFLNPGDRAQMLVQINSFGFKHGLPHDADLVFDVRFLPNPNYDRDIGHLDGHCEPVIDYVMREEVTGQFLGHLGSFVDFCVPQYEKEGKAYLSIAIGCTGGRHRSVVLSNWLADRLKGEGHRVAVSHRDLHRSVKEGNAKLRATDKLLEEQPSNGQAAAAQGTDGQGTAATGAGEQAQSGTSATPSGDQS
jgi:UPF0042 nucleotide-binding protein